MNSDDRYIRRGKIILSISVIFLITAIGLFVIKNTNLSSKESFALSYETIDIKTMGVAKVSEKKTSKDNIFSTIVSAIETNSKVKEVVLADNKTKIEEQPVKLETSVSKPAVVTPPKPIWRLPTEQGYITQYAHSNHIALDITSARGTNERIYPVAIGVITSIYHDAYGAKVITISHNVNGKFYTSQYAHLSWFASGIYVGQEVTTDTVLGGMGATGLATGIHLHLTLTDCNLYVDPHCSHLGQFYNYTRTRVNQGFKGLDSVMYVPYSWYSR